MPSKVLSPYLTTYDLLKTFAILLTVLDHVGYFFYPDNEWFRVAGRGAVPIWCFLIGYASSRDVGRDLWLWAGALLLSNFIFGGNIFPLNMLFTILATRLVLDRFAHLMFRNWEILLYGFAALCLLIIPSGFAVEYGTASILLALCGYAVRHQDELPVSLTTQRVFIFATIFIHALSQIVFFGFEAPQARVAGLLMGGIMLMLYFFKPLEFPKWSNRLPRPLVESLQFSGRYTMEIYVIHLIAFKAVAASYGLVKYGFFDWRWIY